MTFYDDNQLRSYPLTGNDDGLLPADCVVDCLVHAVDALGKNLAIASFSSTPGLISVVLSIDGVHVAYATVPRSAFVPHTQVDLIPVVPGASGFIVFGNGLEREQFRVDGPYPLVDEALISYPGATVGGRVVTLETLGHELFGTVLLEGAGGLEVVGRTMRVKKEDGSIVTTPVALVRPVLPSLSRDPVSACWMAAEASLSPGGARSLNGVPPSLTGQLEIQVVNIREVTSTPRLLLGSSGTSILLVDEGRPCE